MKCVVKYKLIMQKKVLVLDLSCKTGHTCIHDNATKLVVYFRYKVLTLLKANITVFLECDNIQSA